MSKLFTVSVIALALAATPAFAGGLGVASDTASAKVSYADLDVASTAGAKVLKSRIERAASRVCGGPVSVRELKAAMEYKSCVGDAIASAVSNAGFPALAALYEEPLVTIAQN